MNDDLGKRLFPLALEAFERYLHADDWGPYPADGLLQLTFRGSLRREMFEEAIEAALARHPLMQAWIDHDARGRPVWVAAADRRPFITWDPAVRPANCPRGPRIDLRNEVGSRFFLREDGDRTEMLMQMRHLCCDGLGLAQIIEDLLLEYQRRFDGRAELPPLRTLDPQRLRRRGHFGLGWGGSLCRLPLDLAAGLAAFEYFGHRPTPIGGTESPLKDDGVPLDYPPLLSHALTAEETKGVSAAAKRQSVTVNDLLLRDLFVALDGRITADDPDKESPLIRIMIPMSLRVPGDEATPAANIVGMTYLDRRPSKFQETKLLASVHREMRLLKWVRAGITLNQAIRVVERLPGGLRTMLPYERCLATAVLSNWGILERMLRVPQTDGFYRAGDAILERVGAAPPIRPLTRAAFLVIHYAGRLNITLQYDSHVLSPPEGQDLLDRFVGRLRRSILLSPPCRGSECAL